jgi:putative transposase
MDFVTDSIVIGRRFRALAIVDGFSQECPAIEVDTSLGGARVVSLLDRLAETSGLPEIITITARSLPPELWMNGLIEGVSNFTSSEPANLWRMLLPRASSAGYVMSA